jgi:heme exporter protein D
MLDFNAGKYAPFVWPAYALTALVFAGLIADSLTRARKWKRAALAQGQAATEAETDPR